MLMIFTFTGTHRKPYYVYLDNTWIQMPDYKNMAATVTNLTATQDGFTLRRCALTLALKTLAPFKAENYFSRLFQT